MSINPQDYPHVWERFLQLGTDRDESIKRLRQEMAWLDKKLLDLSKIAKDTFRTMEERTDAYEDIKMIREDRLNCLNAIDTLTASPPIVLDEPFVTRRRNEFARICRLSQISSAFVDSDEAINLIVNANYVYEGIEYFMGQWAIVFGHPNPFREAVVTNFKRRIRPNWEPGKYPEYSLDDNTFCLGGNSRSIAFFFDQGRYFDAVQLCVYAVNSVNRGDEYLVPQAFYPTTYVEITEGVIKWPHSMNGPMIFT